MLAFPDFPRCLRDRIEQLGTQELHLVVGESCRFLHRSKRAHEAGELAELDTRDGEILHRPQSLDPVERRCRNFALAQEVVLGPAGSVQLEAWGITRRETGLASAEGVRAFHP